ncbi:MAG: PAS domain S-box protein [Gemmatimonadota bacterium]
MLSTAGGDIGRIRVLSVGLGEDEAADVARLLREAGCEADLHRVASERAFEEEFASGSFHAVFIALDREEDVDALDIAGRIGDVRRRAPHLPVVLFLGEVDESVAIGLLRAGADDYVWKRRPERLGPAVTQALERRRALAESASLLRILDHGLHEIYVADAADLRFLWANAAACENLGRSLEELRELTPLDITAPEVRERIRPRLKELTDAASIGLTLRNEHVRKDGTTYPVEVHIDRASFAGRDAVVGLVLDLTERRVLESELDLRARRFQAVVETTGDALLITDAEGGILQCNRAAEEVFRARQEALCGANVLDLMPESARERFEEVLRAWSRSRREGRVFAGEVGAIRRDGSEFPADVTVGVWLEDGAPVFAFAVRDLSDREKGEAERRLWAAAAEQGDGIVMVTDADANLTYVNPAFTRVTGYAPEEVLSRNPRLLKSGHHPPSFYEEMWATLLRGETWNCTFVNRRKDGSLFHFRTAVLPIRDQRGRTLRYMAVGRDVTQELKAQELAERAEKMALVEALSAGIAHDFKNILAAARNNVRMAWFEAGRGGGEARDILRDAWDALERGEALARRLLAFAREGELSLSPARLSRVARDALPLLKSILKPGITLDLQVAGEEVAVRADADVVMQILLNLVANARDALPRGGRIELVVTGPEDRVLEGERGVGRAQTYVRLDVRDTGVGMDEETLRRIFDPFFTTKEEGVGTGLGMTMVHTLMERHGGFVEVESAVGEGTTVSLYFPAVSEPGASDSSPASAGAADSAVAADSPAAPLDLLRVEFAEENRGPVVLIVDDEPTLLRVSERVLRRTGFSVLTAGDGGEALDHLGRTGGSVDVLLVDFTLPDMSGVELLEKMRQNGFRGPCVLTSGHEIEASELPQRAIFLAKPWDVEDLARVVAGTLNAES